MEFLVFDQIEIHFNQIFMNSNDYLKFAFLLHTNKVTREDPWVNLGSDLHYRIFTFLFCVCLTTMKIRFSSLIKFSELKREDLNWKLLARQVIHSLVHSHIVNCSNLNFFLTAPYSGPWKFQKKYNFAVCIK